MDEFTQLKKEKIYKTLSNLGEDISLTEWSDTQWYELRGYSTEEARQMVFEKYRAKLLNDDEITQHIVGYREAYIAFDEDEEFDEEKYNVSYINNLATTFSAICEFSIVNGKLVDPKGKFRQIIDTFTAYEIVQGLVRERAYKESQLRRYETLNGQIETKAERFGREVSQYGFLDLPKVACLTEKSQAKLIQKIAGQKVPYAVAMFDYIEFIKHLQDNYFKTKDQLYRMISKLLCSDIDGRVVKGNIASLSGYSGENKKRYTAYQHTETVKNDYEALK